MSIVDTYREDRKFGEADAIQEGPSYEYRDGDGTKRENWPFACRLMLHLQDNGAVIGYQAGENYKHGGAAISGPVGSDRLVHSWTQIYASQDEPETLGDQIMRRFGKNITFGEMIIPRAHALQWIGYSQSGPVWVRHMGQYHVGSDEVIQRWDVLVRST